ncbi:hypothetical protein [Spirosoma sp. KUDC1026]|uniref:hypothetical protein n=1 Tax=Spirosoma sp. KUDC1026 TaxID=2745947 RepID=UPI00159BCA4A|nr:hypothetical protein [Spirosoma sp. KUDC1026]QKZ15136.1 hypothetical protein HU175_21935 [Spirosoma sp. KUDC1026]
MAKLFVFAIGGTGSRVLKALTMLLASGVKMNNTDEIIPIVLDPHATNDDLLRTKELLREYGNIRAGLQTKPTEGFFSTEIKTLNRAIGGNATIADTYVFELQGVQQEKFRDYINYEGLDAPAKALAGLLFSEENLETKMDIGFVGNPNIGSTVLNQFRYSDVFQAFAENFGANDRIFIISSIFGGTGAAGFPILLKNIRAAQSIGQISNPAFLRDAKIGAVTVMPYFSLTTNDNKLIDPASFIAKTKAALNYYQKGVNPSVNALYYIGDDQTKAYAYDPGAGGQKNEAHFVEMASALAMVDFMNMSDSELAVSNGRPNNPVFKEFGVEQDGTTFQLGNLAAATRQIINLPLAKMALFSTYLSQRLKSAAGSVQWAKANPPISTSFVNSSFFNSVKNFDTGFRQWLSEMGANKRGFEPFLLDAGNLGHTVRGFEPKKKGIFGGESDVKLDIVNDFDQVLNKTAEGKAYVSEPDKFIQLFSEGTDRFVRERLPKVMDY